MSILIAPALLTFENSGRAKSFPMFSQTNLSTSSSTNSICVFVCVSDFVRTDKRLFNQTHHLVLRVEGDQ